MRQAITLPTTLVPHRRPLAFACHGSRSHHDAGGSLILGNFWKLFALKHCADRIPGAGASVRLGFAGGEEVWGALILRFFWGGSCGLVDCAYIAVWNDSLDGKIRACAAGFVKELLFLCFKPTIII